MRCNGQKTFHILRARRARFAVIEVTGSRSATRGSYWTRECGGTVCGRVWARDSPVLVYIHGYVLYSLITDLAMARLRFLASELDIPEKVSLRFLMSGVLNAHH